MIHPSEKVWSAAVFDSPDRGPDGATPAPRLQSDDVPTSAIPGFVTSPFIESVQPAEVADEKAVYMRIINDMEQECNFDEDEDRSTNHLLLPSALSSVNTEAADGIGGGSVERISSFTVEESYGPSPHPYVPPPVYGSPSQSSSSPYVYTAAAHNGHPPPPFSVAIATTPPFSGIPVDISPLGSRFAPQMPAAQNDPILVRNQYGVFVLHPVTKPTPPYTPPMTVTTPMTPMTRCALPPAALPPLFTAVHQNVEQFGAGKKVPGAYGAPLACNAGVGGSHILSSGVTGVASGEALRGSGTYTYMSACIKSPAAPVHAQPPPPYPYDDTIEPGYQSVRDK